MQKIVNPGQLLRIGYSGRMDAGVSGNAVFLLPRFGFLFSAGADFGMLRFHVRAGGGERGIHINNVAMLGLGADLVQQLGAVVG